MKEVINCYKEENPLIHKKLKTVSVPQGKKIATELFNIIVERGDAIGLAANQVGIDASVAVVNVQDEPVYLINPRIIDQWDKVNYKEGCLSYPNTNAYTERYKYCIIEVGGSRKQKLYFGPAFIPNKETGEDMGDPKGLLESICVQHEIDHLNGKTCLKNVERVPLKKETDYGRNDKVIITDGTVEKELKWKKAKPLINNGGWSIK